MSETHTAGPWYADEGTDGAFDICVDNNARGRFMVICSRGPHSNFPEETRANGRLIAAAPDLLEALKLVMHEVVESGNDTQQFGWGKANAAARAAIAKATGEPS